MTIRPTPRDIAALRIGKRGPAFVDITPSPDGVRLSASNGYAVSVLVAGDIDRAVRMTYDAFLRAAKLGGKDGFVLDAKACTAGGYRFPVTLSVPDASPTHPTEFAISFTEDMATKLLARVLPSMSDDDSRPQIHCLHLARKGDVLTATATNGHILAHFTHPNVGRDFDVMIPAAAVRSVARMRGDLTIHADRFPTIPDVKTRLMFVRGTSTVACDGVANVGLDRKDVALPSLSYPDHAAVIPTTWESSVTVDAAEFRRVVSRLGKYAVVNHQVGVRMEYRGGIVCSTMADYDGGRLTAPTLSCDGAMLRIVSVQARYLLAAIGTKGPVTLRFSGELDPVRIEHDGVLCIAMPLRE